MPSAPRSTLVRARRLIDGTGSAPVADAWIVVRGTRIAAVGSGRPPADVDRAIDLPDGTLLPGLIDAHAHLGALSRDAAWLATLDAETTADLIFENCRIALLEGFTCVRDAGGLDGGVVAAIASGPRVLPAGQMLLHADAGSPSGLHALSVSVSGPDEVGAAAAAALARGATQIKVVQSGSLAEDLSTDRFSVAELAAAVAAARAHRTYVMSHVFNRAGIAKGLAAGVTSFEHCFELDSGTADRMRSHGAAHVITLSILHRVVTEGASLGFPAESVRRSRELLDPARAAVRISAARGVLMGSGSDLLGAPQTGRGLELRHLAEEVGPLRAIAAATTGNARVLGVDRTLGRLAPGMAADVLGVDGDPMQEPARLGHVALVVQAGRVVVDPARDDGTSACPPLPRARPRLDATA